MPWGLSPPGDLPKPVIEARSPTLQVDSSPPEPPGKPMFHRLLCLHLIKTVNTHIHLICLYPITELNILKYIELIYYTFFSKCVLNINYVLGKIQVLMIQQRMKVFQRRHTDIKKKHMKRCSISLTVREMKIKTTTWYHLTPVRMAIIKNLQIITAAEGVDNSEHSCAVGGNVN